MSQLIDLSGLSPEAVKTVESLVDLLRENTSSPNGTHQSSIFDLIGKAPKLRTADEIAQQIQEERDSWGDN